MKKSVLFIVLIAAMAVSCSRNHVCPSYDSSGIKSASDVMKSHKGKR